MTETVLCARTLAKQLASHRTPVIRRAVYELLITALPFAIFWGAAAALASRGQWWGMIFTVPAAAFLVRLFMIQHDCGHGSFLADRRANDWLGRVIGVLTLTPYAYWRQTHAIHHGTSGNLDRREAGAVETLTVEEYRALSPLGRLGYRAYRHPLVLFGVGPAYVFVVQHRWPKDLTRAGWRPWASVMGTNLALLGAGALMSAWIGLGAFLAVHLAVAVMAASAGVWLFYVQHQFEETWWARKDRWGLHEAALHGSSYYELPAPLRWLTANIGVHHVHHVDSRIPSYRLWDVLHAHPELKSVSRITFRDSLRCVRLALWDEPAGRLVSFREAARLA